MGDRQLDSNTRKCRLQPTCDFPLKMQQDEREPDFIVSTSEVDSTNTTTQTPESKDAVSVVDSISREPNQPLEISPLDKTECSATQPIVNMSDSKCTGHRKSRKHKVRNLSLQPRVSRWKEVETLMIFSYGDPPPSEKLACFDLDHTLIRPVSRRKMSYDPEDWKFLPNVVPKLQFLHTSGYKIVIYTNQQCLSNGNLSKPEFRGKIESIANKLELPFQLLAATSRDFYRKPCPQGFEHFLQEENGGLEVDKSLSIFVGDAAGRVENWRPGSKKDFSCSDRQFAANIQLPFATPDEFFDGLPVCTKFSWGPFVPSRIDYTKTTPTLTPPTTKISMDSQEVIVFVGYPAAGKSTFYTDHLGPHGYVHINKDVLGSWRKCLAKCTEQLAAGRSVVIDDTNPDVESRRRYISCARAASVSVRCFRFMTSFMHARHNNVFREMAERCSWQPKVGEQTFQMYTFKFCEPVLSEGFTEIVKVEISPHFKDKQKERLYKMFLAFT